MSVPFSDVKEYRIFAKSVNNFIFEQNNQKMSLYTSAENMYILHHGRSFSSTESNGSELKNHSVDMEFEYSDIRLYNIKQFYKFLNDFIERISSEMIKTVYQTISATCDKTGNVIDAKQKKISNPEAFLEMLKKVEFSVDKDGNVLMPSIHLHSGQSKKIIDELQAQGPDFLNIVEEIKKIKSEEAINRENERLLKFEGIILE